MNRYRRNRRLPITLIATLALTCACEQPVPAAAEATTYGCDRDAHLGVELYGGIRATIDWPADILTCDSMPRPDGEGARLRFSGPGWEGSTARTIAFILGIPDLQPGSTGTELPTHVTLIEEGSGRFFATQDTNGCWTDIDRHEAATRENVSSYRISGTLYCVAALAELNGGSSISFTELNFAGRLNWEQPK